MTKEKDKSSQIKAAFDDLAPGMKTGDIMLFNGQYRITSYNVCYTKLLR